jgi:uncharacterized transporter YbjL
MISKKNVFEHVDFFLKRVNRAIVEFENEHFENFSRQMTFVLRLFRESSQIRERVDCLFNFLTKIDFLDF